MKLVRTVEETRDTIIDGHFSTYPSGGVVVIYMGWPRDASGNADESNLTTAYSIELSPMEARELSRKLAQSAELAHIARGGRPADQQR